MHALVTGAGGFLGRHIVGRLAARGDRVRALVRRPTPELESPGVEIVLGDVRDRAAVAQACRGVDAVFHTAAVAGIWGPWRHFYETNVVGTRHIVESCRALDVARLIFTSSPSVTFDGSPQEGIDESAPYAARWLCHYPHTKAIAEREVLAANIPGKLATCALRPHLIWGPGDPHLVPRLLARARAGRLRRVGDGTNLIDTIHVENAAAAHLQAADALAEPNSPVAGRAYFLSQGEPVNCWQWIDELLSMSGLPPVARSISLRAAWRVGAILEAIHATFRIQTEPRMTRFLAAQLGTSHWFDIRRAEQDFGYRPAIDMEEGMRQLRETFGTKRRAAE